MLHAEELVNSMQAHSLQSCLPSGTPTYWSICRPGQRSTLDLTLSNVPGSLIKCDLYDDNSGSDHRATASEWQIHVGRRRTQPARKAFERANWSKIGAAIQRILAASTLSELSSPKDLEEIAKRASNFVPAARAEMNIYFQSCSSHQSVPLPRVSLYPTVYVI